jgi:hypothetical protein
MNPLPSNPFHIKRSATEIYTNIFELWSPIRELRDLRTRSPLSHHPSSPGSSQAVSPLPLVPSTPVRSRSLSISFAQEQEQDVNARAAARITKKRVLNREVNMLGVFKEKAPGIGKKGKERGGVKTKEREKVGMCVLLVADAPIKP